MRIHVWWRCTGSRWNRGVFISAAVMGRRQENIWLLWRVCLLWNAMARSMKSTEIRCLNLKRIRSMFIGTQGRRKPAVPVSFWIIIDTVVSGILSLKQPAAGGESCLQDYFLCDCWNYHSLELSSGSGAGDFIRSMSVKCTI